MAHNINQSREKASFASAKELPWHGLGQIVDHTMTSAEAIQEAQLDYEVKLTPVKYEIEVFEQLPPMTLINCLPNKFVTYREDTGEGFGVVGKKYTVVQNKDAFAFFDAIVGSGEAIYETVGALGRGETVFITAKLPGSIRVGNNDDIDKYLLLTMGHDGNNSIQAMFTPVRVVCNNTLNSALNLAAKRVSIRHTSSAIENLKAAHKILGITSKLSMEVEQVLNMLAKCKITDSQLETAIINTFLTKEELRELAKQHAEISLKSVEVSDLPLQRKKVITNAHEYMFTGPGQQLESCSGTAFGFYNGIAGYFQNAKEFKSDEKKFVNNLVSSNYNVMNKAFDLALQLAN